LAKKEFHGTELNTPFFAICVAAITALFSWKYALLALFCIGTHLLMDLCCSIRSVEADSHSMCGKIQVDRASETFIDKNGQLF
jgi:hypothetical protein